MRVLVTGYRGFVGQAVCRRLVQHNHTVLFGPRIMSSWWYELAIAAPDAVIHLAKPRSDGIGTMAKEPFTFAAGVLDLDLQVIRACAFAKPQPKLVCLGSVCAYPDWVGESSPAAETELWEGYPEAVNAPYGIAKRTQLMLLQAARQETGLNGIHLVMANVYGPGDRSGHVIPATIRKMRAAGTGPIVVWGSPDVSRSFLYVEDAAEGIVRALEDYDSPKPLNLAPPQEFTMNDLCHHFLRPLLNFTGDIGYDPTKPTGSTRRWYDLTGLRQALNWTPPTRLDVGLKATVEWMKETETEKEEESR